MKNLLLFRLLSFFTVCFCFAVSIYADTTFTATLNGGQETPPNSSSATGEGSVVLNQAETEITVTLNFSGLTATQTAAHIHQAGRGTAGAVIIALPNGSLSQSFPVSAEQVSNLKAGLWYFNVHTANFPGGEIRGQIESLCEPPFYAAGTETKASARVKSIAANVCTSNALLTSGTSNGKIAFARDSGGNFEIFTINPDGSSPMNITNNPNDDVQPAFSPDGGKIAFGSYRNDNDDIYVMNADGSNQIRLTTDAAYDSVPSWSPDGSKIVFYSERNENGDVYVMNADGTNQTRLTIAEGFDYNPKFSPDGSQIVFVSTRDEFNAEIYVMDATGANQTRLTNDAGADEYPAFSPDGSRIAFHSNRAGNVEIFSVNARGGTAVNLTNNAADDFYPEWSPDGTQIAFERDLDVNREIYKMNRDGTNQTRLTESESFDFYPAWQRNVFAPASNVVVAPAKNLKVVFGNILQTGYTVATAMSAGQLPLLPAGYGLRSDLSFDLRTSAQHTGGVNVRFTVPGVFDQTTCSALRVLHFVNGNWDESNNSAPIFNSNTCTVSQFVTSLSPIVVAEQNQLAQGRTLFGKIIYGATPSGQSPKFVSGVMLTAAGTANRVASSDPAGNYLINNLNASEVYSVTASKTGNANGISALDATLVLRHLASNGKGASALNSAQQIAADANGNGTITAIDATMILRYAATNGTVGGQTGQTGSWKFVPNQRVYGSMMNSLAGENYTAFLIGDVNGTWML